MRTLALRKLIGSLRRKALRADAKQRQGFVECYDKALLECKQGWTVGPFTKSEMDAMFPSGWHPSERFTQ